MMKRRLTYTVLLCFLSSLLFAADIEAPIEFSNARMTAMGGYHAALTDDVMTLFNNPAGMSSRDTTLMISQFTLGVTGPVFSIADAIIGGDPLADPNFKAMMSSIYATTELMGPLSFAYVGNGLGIGIFSWTDILFEGRGLNLVNDMAANILISGGYSFPIQIDEMNTVHIGLLAKAILRGQMIDTNYIASMFVNMGVLLDGSFVFSVGGGADLGVLYTYNKSFAFGINCRNLYTGTARYEYASVIDFYNGGSPVSATPSAGIVPLDLSAGVKWAPPLGLTFGHYVSDLILLLDYTDILDSVTHPESSKFWLLHISMGLELRLLEILSVRAGFSDGLPAAGLGLDLSFFKINASMFGSELSPVPGLQPEYNFVLGFEFIL